MFNPKTLLNRKTLIVAVPLTAFVVVILLLIVKNSQLANQLKEKSDSFERLHSDDTQLKNKFAALQKELEQLKRDLEETSDAREKLDIQVKGLLKDRDLARQLEGALENSKKEKELLIVQKETAAREKQDAINEGAALREKIKSLEGTLVGVAKEKEQLLAALEELRDKSGIKKLEQENSALKRENDNLGSGIKRLEGEAARLKESEAKLKTEVAVLKERLESTGKEYAQATQKNKSLEQAYMEAPAKCAELARQNKALIKRTANMHYNMGVYYTKQKEYSRAIAEFENAVELDPHDAFSYFNLGYIYAEYLDNKPKAIELFRRYLQCANKDDKDVDWAKKYIVTWQAWEGKQPMD